MANTGFLVPVGALLQVLSDQGVVGSGFQLNTYVGGTVSTPLTTYTTASLSVTNPNPIVLQSNGRLPANTNIWVPAGTLTKLVLMDASSNIISGGTIDNVPAINDLSTTAGAIAGGTYWAGLDTGAANAYVCTLTAPFLTAYANGQVVWFVPAHTNTGTSTININSLGTVNIINPDGNNILAGELVASEPAMLLYYSGNFILMSTLDGAGTFTGTLTGMTATTTGTINYVKAGGMGMLYAASAITGTSNATTFTMTGLPTEMQPQGGTLEVMAAEFENNTVANLLGSAVLTAGSGTITFKLSNVAATSGPVNFSGSAWTNSGTKGLAAGFCLVYPLQ